MVIKQLQFKSPTELFTSDTIAYIRCALFVAFICWPLDALACNLSPLSWKPKVINFSFDQRDQPLEINKTLYFLSENQAHEIVEVSQVVFYDFQDLYENFVLKRITPKSRCDKIRSSRFKVGVDKKGLLYGQFLAHYEDYMCFPLRFFQPTPGVEKEPQVLRLADGYVQVENAISPSLQKGKIYFAMSTFYKDLSDPNVTGKQTSSDIEKLYGSPLEGILNDDLFVMFLEDVSIGLKSVNKKNNSTFNIESVKFMKDQYGRIVLQLISNILVSKPDMCAYMNNKLQSGSWKRIDKK